MDTLAGKRALVTGGAKRIGRAICRSLARRGMEIVVHYRKSEREAAALVEELGGSREGHRTWRADLAVDSERCELIRGLAAAGQSPEVLVNNASVYRRGSLKDLTDRQLQEDYTINFFAPLLLMKEFASHCRQGCIINLLDQRVALVESKAGAYGLAKKSLRDATEAAALEWAPDIRVNGVAPGFVLPPPGVDAAKMTPLLTNVPMNRQTSAEEIADCCGFLAASETITGTILYADGGMHLVHPSREEVAPSSS